MKYRILLITLFSCCTTFGQTAAEHFERGEQEERKYNFDAAITEYTKAIEADPEFIDAYYLRGNLLYTQKKYQAALSDADKAISLKPDAPEYHRVLLMLRGECYLKIKDKEKACQDFIKASQLGEDVKEEYLAFCNYQRIKNEIVYVNLPDKKNWEIHDQSVKDNQYLILLNNEKTKENLSLIRSKGVKNSNLEQVLNDAYNNLKGKSGATRLNFIEKDLNAKDPWIMYLVNNVTNETRNIIESQVWFLIQGENSLHTCVLSIQSDLLTKEKKEEMIQLFKTAKIVYQ